MLNDTVACFKEIEEYFGIEIAIGVVQIRTIILSSKVSNSELNAGSNHSFERRMKKLSRRFLHNMSDRDFDLCWEIVEVIPSWQIGREMLGIGGSCVMKVKDLLAPPKKLSKPLDV